MATVTQYTLKDGTTKRWMVRWRDADGRERKRRGFRLRRDADGFRLKVENALFGGDQVPDPKRAARINIAKVVDDYLSTKLDVRESTRKRDRSVATSLILSRLEGATVGSLQQDDVQSWVGGLVDDGYSAETIRKAYQLLSAAFELGVDRRLVPRNPCRNVKVPSIQKLERPYLSISELFALADEVAHRYRSMILLAGMSGLRWGEAAGLRRSRLSLTRVAEPGRIPAYATITIDATLGRDRKLHPPKTTGSRATLALPQVTVEGLSEHLAAYDIGPDDFMFTTPEGKPLDYNRFRVRVLAPAVRTIGRPDVTFHSLRHTAGAILQQQGEHLQVIQRMMRHEDISTSLNRYGHLTADISEQAASAIDKAVALARVPIVRPQDQNRVAQLRP